MIRRLAGPPAGLVALALIAIGCSQAPRYDLGDTPVPTTIPSTTTTLPDVTEVLDAGVAASVELALPDDAVVHVIEAGDVLYDLALEYGTSIDAVLEANPSLDPGAVSVGTEVVIPTDG